MRIRPQLRHACAAVAGALVVGLVMPAQSFAQTIVETWATTYNGNPDLLASRATLRQTDETLSQAVANWRPRISLTAEYNKIQADSFSRLRNPTFLELNGKTSLLTVTQPLFRGGKTVADTGAARANIQAQRALLADAEQTVLLNAVTSYADLLRDRGIVEVRRNNVRVLTEQLTATRERFRVGELTITDVAQAEARREQSNADLVLAEANVRIDEAAYQRTVGQRPGPLADLPLIGQIPGSEEENIALAMDAGPRAVSAQHRIAAANFGVNSVVGDLLPQINLVGFAQSNADVSTPTDQFYNYGFRVQATVPIFQNGTEWSRIRSAKELVGQRRNELDSARRLAAETVIRAWRNLESSRSRVVSFSAQVKANETALNGVRRKPWSARAPRSTC